VTQAAGGLSLKRGLCELHLERWPEFRSRHCSWTAISQTNQGKQQRHHDRPVYTTGDAVQEVQRPAEYGQRRHRVAAHGTNVVTKSGSNQFMGSLVTSSCKIPPSTRTIGSTILAGQRSHQKAETSSRNIRGPIRKNRLSSFSSTRQPERGARHDALPAWQSLASARATSAKYARGMVGRRFPRGNVPFAAGQIWDRYSSTYSSSLNGSGAATFVPFNISQRTSPGKPQACGTPYELPIKAQL